MEKFAIAIHGGAGGFPFWGMTRAREQQYISALRQCINAGYSVLENNGSAVEAVTEAVISLENEPLFNAGKGAVMNRRGYVEMDASIMDGRTLRAGACSAVRYVKNPVLLARMIMDRCEHLYLTGEGALDFAFEMKLELEDEEYFKTPERVEKWNYLQAHSGANVEADTGTAGAVALDVYGNLAAATSTGGLMNKRKGRVGDTSIIGAGTYANNETCAVTCTGEGEYILRTLTAHEISSLIKYKGLELNKACEFMLHERVNPLGGKFGMIALDTDANIHCVFNTPRMYRAWIANGGELEIKLY